MSSKKVFVISWFFPPINSSEGLVTFKLLKNSNYQYDVWTRRELGEDIWDRKVDDSKLVADNITALFGDGKNKTKWIEGAVKYFEQHRDEYCFMMSRIMPPESNIAAAKIKGKFPDVKWVASFGDPLVDSPYIDDLKKGDNPHTMQQYREREEIDNLGAIRLIMSPARFAKKYLWERDRVARMKIPNKYREINTETFQKADMLIFNNSYQFERAFCRKETNMHREKGIIINHSFDEDLYPAVNKKKNNNKMVRLVHAGHLDDRRNARPLLNAIKTLKEKDPNLRKRLRLDFYGHMCESDMASIIKNKIEDVAHVNDNIPYIESLGKIEECDWAVLIDANLNSELDDYIYLPAKLIDYLGAKKNVFAISQYSGATSDVVRDTGCGIRVSHSADEIAMYLSMIINKKYNPTNYNLKELSKYNSKQVAKVFDRAVATMIGRQ